MKKVTRLLHNFSLLLFFGLFLLSGCAKKTEAPAQEVSQGLIIPSLYVRTEAATAQDSTQQPEQLHAKVAVSTDQELFEQFEARSSDVYFPLGFVAKKFQQHEKYIYIEGYTERTLGQVTQDCQQEMERSGWYMHVHASFDPVLVIFNKPQSVCVYRIVQERSSWISLRASTLMHIWVYSTL